jgi:trk system potassium uptake protein TrkH
MNKDFLTLNQNTLTREAAKLLQYHEIDDIIVTDDNKHPIGIVTDEDIIRKVSDVTVRTETTSLREIMSSPLVTVDEKTTLQDALHKMRDRKIRKIPVLSKNNEVLGIIFQTTIANVIRDATSTAPRLLSPPMKAILGNLGFVLQFAGVLLLIPAILSTILAETVTAAGIYLTSVLLLVTGFFFNSYGEKANLNLQQASIVVFLSFFLLILFGMIPYLYVLNQESTEVFANAFFSSASGFTTGGLSHFDESEKLPDSFTFYRSFTQLVGAMSFIYLVIAVFYPNSKIQSMRGFISGRTLHMRELFGTIVVIFTIYVVIVTTLLYVFGERNIIDIVSLSISALSTGGFVPTSTITSNLLWQEQVILMGAMILGALPFTFHYTFVKKKFLTPTFGKEILTYFAILACATVLFIFLSGLDPLTGAFYSISASTTTGLQTENVAEFNGSARLILIGLMLVGGCSFSAAGGIKIFRLLQLRECKKIFYKKTRSELSPETRKDAISALVIIMLFPVIASLTAAHLAISDDITFENAFFESTSIITTTGLSTGLVDFNTDASTKIWLSFLMIFGRLELIAIAYIFVPKLS